jgi:hypothetical protein
VMLVQTLYITTWTPCPKWSTGRIAMRVAIRLIEHNSGQTSLDMESLK